MRQFNDEAAASQASGSCRTCASSATLTRKLCAAVEVPLCKVTMRCCRPPLAIVWSSELAGPMSSRPGVFAFAPPLPLPPPQPAKAITAAQLAAAIVQLLMTFPSRLHAWMSSRPPSETRAQPYLKVSAPQARKAVVKIQAGNVEHSTLRPAT